MKRQANEIKLLWETPEYHTTTPSPPEFVYFRNQPTKQPKLTPICSPSLRFDFAGHAFPTPTSLLIDLLPHPQLPTLPALSTHHHPFFWASHGPPCWLGPFAPASRASSQAQRHGPSGRGQEAGPRPRRAGPGAGGETCLVFVVIFLLPPGIVGNYSFEAAEPTWKKENYTTIWSFLAHMPKANRPFDLLVFLFWSIFSQGARRVNFCFQVLWATDLLNQPGKGKLLNKNIAQMSESGFCPPKNESPYGFDVCFKNWLLCPFGFPMKPQTWGLLPKKDRPKWLPDLNFIVMASPSPMIRVFRKSSTHGNSRFLHRMMVEKNGTSTRTFILVGTMLMADNKFRHVSTHSGVRKADGENKSHPKLSSRHKGRV